MSMNGRDIDQLGGATIVLGGGGEIRFVIRKAADSPTRAKQTADFVVSAEGREQTHAIECGDTWRMVHMRRSPAPE